MSNVNITKGSTSQWPKHPLQVKKNMKTKFDSVSDLFPTELVMRLQRNILNAIRCTIWLNTICGRCSIVTNQVQYDHDDLYNANKKFARATTCLRATSVTKYTLLG